MTVGLSSFGVQRSFEAEGRFFEFFRGLITHTWRLNVLGGDLDYRLRISKGIWHTDGFHCLMLINDLCYYMLTACFLALRSIFKLVEKGNKTSINSLFTYLNCFNANFPLSKLAITWHKRFLLVWSLNQPVNSW